MDKQDREKALALLGALISPVSTIASLGLQKMMPPREEFENSLFSRVVTDSEGKPNRNEMGEMEILPENVSEGAFWKKGSPLLPRFLKPETKLSPVTQERLVQEMIRAVGATKDEAIKNRKGQTVMEMMNKLPMKEGKGVSGAELQKLASESGSTSHKKGEVNGLRVLQNALANRSIYHGIKTPDGENRLWQELFKPPGEARDVRAAMVKRRVEKNVATPKEREEYQLKTNSEGDLSTALMDSLRALGKWPPKIGGGSDGPSAPVPPEITDINNRTWWHGTSAPNLSKEKLDPFSTNSLSLFGPGIYMTDSPEIATSYAKVRSKSSPWGTKPEGTPELYQSKVNMGKILDMEKEAGDDVVNLFKTRLDPEYADNLTPLLTKKGVTPEELYSAHKRDWIGKAKDQGWPVSEAIEAFDAITEDFTKLGYEGITHTGGKRVGGGDKLHKVLIALEPKKITTFDKAIKTREDVAAELLRDYMKKNNRKE